MRDRKPLFPAITLGLTPQTRWLMMRSFPEKQLAGRKRCSLRNPILKKHGMPLFTNLNTTPAKILYSLIETSVRVLNTGKNSLGDFSPNRLEMLMASPPNPKFSEEKITSLTKSGPKGPKMMQKIVSPQSER